MDSESSSSPEDSSQLSRNRSFKSKQLVRSQALRESQSPPRTLTCSPAVAAATSPPVTEVAHHLATDHLAAAHLTTDHLATDHLTTDDPPPAPTNGGFRRVVEEKRQPVEIQITSGAWDEPCEQRQRARRWLGGARHSSDGDLLTHGPRVFCVCGRCGRPAAVDCKDCRGRRQKLSNSTKQDSGVVCSDDCLDCSDSNDTTASSAEDGEIKKRDSNEGIAGEHHTCRCQERKQKNLSLHRSDSDDKSEPTGVDLVNFIKETLNKSPRDRMTLLKIEKELNALVNDTGRCIVKFPAMTSYGRMLVHRCAALYQLSHHVDASGSKCVLVSKTGTSGGRLPCTGFRAWCAQHAPAHAPQPHDTQARSILKRAAHSLEEANSANGAGNSRSKSLEQREEEYERVRRRIFSAEDYQPEEVQWPWLGSSVRLLAPNGGKPSRLTKVQSLECGNTETGGGGVNGAGGRTPVSKSHSFGGYGRDEPQPRLLSRQGDLASSSWRLSPSSSGYKTLSLRSTDSVTPSPTGGVSPEPAGDCRMDSSLVWAVTDLSSIPVGALILHPQTGRPLSNADGSLYHYDPANPPVMRPEAAVENGKKEALDKRRGRLEKQNSFIENECEYQTNEDYAQKPETYNQKADGGQNCQCDSSDWSQTCHCCQTNRPKPKAPSNDGSQKPSNQPSPKHEPSRSQRSESRLSNADARLLSLEPRAQIYDARIHDAHRFQSTDFQAGNGSQVFRTGAGSTEFRTGNGITEFRSEAANEFNYRCQDSGSNQCYRADESMECVIPKVDSDKEFEASDYETLVPCSGPCYVPYRVDEPHRPSHSFDQQIIHKQHSYQEIRPQSGGGMVIQPATFPVSNHCRMDTANHQVYQQQVNLNPDKPSPGHEQNIAYVTPMTINQHETTFQSNLMTGSPGLIPGSIVTGSSLIPNSNILHSVPGGLMSGSLLSGSMIHGSPGLLTGSGLMQSTLIHGSTLIPQSGVIPGSSLIAGSGLMGSGGLHPGSGFVTGGGYAHGFAHSVSCAGSCGVDPVTGIFQCLNTVPTQRYGIYGHPLDQQHMAAQSYSIGNMVVPQGALPQYQYGAGGPGAAAAWPWQPVLAGAVPCAPLPKPPGYQPPDYQHVLKPDLFPVMQYQALQYPQAVPQLCPVYAGARGADAGARRSSATSARTTPLNDAADDAGTDASDVNHRLAGDTELAAKIQQIKEQMSKLNVKSAEFRPGGGGERAGLLGSYQPARVHRPRSLNDESQLNSAARAIVDSIRSMQSRSLNAHAHAGDFQRQNQYRPNRSERYRRDRGHDTDRSNSSQAADRPNSGQATDRAGSSQMDRANTGNERRDRRGQDLRLDAALLATSRLNALNPMCARPFLVRQMSPNTWRRNAPAPVQTGFQPRPHFRRPPPGNGRR